MFPVSTAADQSFEKKFFVKHIGGGHDNICSPWDSPRFMRPSLHLRLEQRMLHRGNAGTGISDLERVAEAVRTVKICYDWNRRACSHEPRDRIEYVVPAKSCRFRLNGERRAHSTTSFNFLTLFLKPMGMHPARIGQTRWMWP